MHAIDLLAGADDGRGTGSGNFIEHLEGDHRVMLLVSAQRAAHGIQQEPLRLMDRVLRECLYSSFAAQRAILAVMVSLVGACAVAKRIFSLM